MGNGTATASAVNGGDGGPRPQGESLRSYFERALAFDEMVAGAKANQALWSAVFAHARVPEDVVARVATLGGRWHLLVLSEDWCGDAVNTVPVIARLAERAPNLDLRVLARDENLELMDAHLTGTSRSIPVAIVLDEHFVERGWWGPRPRWLQQWVLGDGQRLAKEERYPKVRQWYARDRGAATLVEIVAILERAAAEDARPPWAAGGWGQAGPHSFAGQ